MARRRVNTKFLTFVIAPVVLLLGLAVVYVTYPPIREMTPIRQIRHVTYLWRGTPGQHRILAKQAFEKGDYKKALEEYKRSAQIRGTADADLYTALGDCYSQLVLEDPDNNLRLAKAYWDQAIAVDPQHIEALRRLLNLYQQDADLTGGRSVQKWDSIRDAADKILAIDPNDKSARVAKDRAIIERLVLGVEADPQPVDNAVKDLSELLPKPPFNADILIYLVEYKIHAAQDELRQKEQSAAAAILAEVKKLVDDTIAAHEDDWHVHYRGGQAYRALALTDRTHFDDDIKLALKELQKAATMVKPDDHDYVDVQLVYGDFQNLLGNKAEAEKIFRSLLKERPKDVATRIALAQVLGHSAAQRAEAIDLLTNYPPPDEKEFVGVKALLWRAYQTTMRELVLDFQLDALDETQTPADRTALLKKIDDNYSKFVSLVGVAESSDGLSIRGRIEMAKGDNVDAVQTLDRALKLSPPPASRNDLDHRYRLMFALARAYIGANQSGQAEVLLTQIVNDFGNFLPARLALAQLLLREGDYESARKQVVVLSKFMPDAPIVKILTLYSLDKEKDKAKIAELYDQLPESSVEDVLAKAQAAMFFKRDDEAAALLEKTHAQNPADLNVVSYLVRLYRQRGESDKAIAILDDAAKRHPEHPELLVMKAQASGADTGELRRDLIEKITDPFRKEMGLYSLALQDGNQAEATKHLEAAVKLKPDDKQVLTVQFNDALNRKDWDRAESYLNALTKQNADGADGQLFRIELARAKGDLSTAADLAQQLVQKMPEFAQPWITIGEIQVIQGKYSDAVQSFLTALQKNQSAVAYNDLVGCYYALNQNERAQQTIMQARRVYPNNTQFRDLELQHEVKFGDPEKAIAPRQEILQKAILQKDPQEPNAWLSLGRTYMAAAKSKTNEQESTAFLQKARDTFAQASAKWPDQLIFVQYYADVAVQMHDNADAQKAIEALAARPAFKGKPEPTLLLSAYYASLKQPDQQEKALRDFLGTSSDDVPVRLQLSSLMAEEKRIDDALKILDVNSDNPLIRKQRVDIQVDGGRLKDAEKEIHDLLARTPNPDPGIMVEQALIYMKSGRASEAMPVLDKVLALDPNQPDALLYRGSIYVSSLQNLDQAIRDLQTVIDVAPDAFEPRMVLADAFHAKGDDDSAIHTLEAMVRKWPADKRPRLKLIGYYNRATPPRYIDTEFTLNDALKQPELAEDVDILCAQGTMWLNRKDYSKAVDVLNHARKIAPKNAEVVRIICQVLIESKQYRELLTLSQPPVDAKQARWWLYQYRGRAEKGLDDKQAALDEFSHGLDVATASGNDAGVASIIRTIAEEIGAEQAKVRIITRAEKGENKWRMMMAYLDQLQGDVPGALEWVDKVLNDPNIPPVELENARRSASILYMSMNPPNAAKAIELYRKALENDPNDMSALNNIACAMILPNSGYTPKDALEYSTKAYNIMDRTGAVEPFIIDTQGYVLILNNRVEEGINLLQHALDKKQFADAYLHLGEGYLALPSPQPSDAEKAFQQAIDQINNKSKADVTMWDLEMKSKAETGLARAKQAQPTTDKS